RARPAGELARGPADGHGRQVSGRGTDRPTGRPTSRRGTDVLVSRTYLDENRALQAKGTIRLGRGQGTIGRGRA
ncbi:MAG: hypothetical protein ABIG85_06745, partial [Chloroflexota bacterium]